MRKDIADMLVLYFLHTVLYQEINEKQIQVVCFVAQITGLEANLFTENISTLIYDAQKL